jgi:hypothetical protein
MTTSRREFADPLIRVYGGFCLFQAREEKEPKFRLACRFIPVLQPASRCYMQCCAFRLKLAIRWRYSAAEFLHLLPRAEDKNGMRKFGSLSSLVPGAF